MGDVIWFDGLGSAVIGGVVAAVVALVVTRTQLNHDRRMRWESARDDAFGALAITLTELRASRRPTGYVERELEAIRGLYLRLQKELVAVARVVPERDAELRAWLREFSAELDDELRWNAYRRGTNGAALEWVLAMAAQIEVRALDRSSPLLRRDRPGLGSATS